MKNILPMRHLPLSGITNARDLGGFACDGGVTRWKVFLRSDGTNTATPKDCELLLGYGVYTVVDLRSIEEGQKDPSVLAATPGFAVHQNPMNDQMHAANFQSTTPNSMAELYVWLLDKSQAELASAIRLLLCEENGALYHCTAGKDRTGVVSMLLLKAVGVSDEDVIADYSVTEIYIEEKMQGKAKELKESFGIEIPAFLFQSKAESIVAALAHLHSSYGSAEKYLLEIGISPEEIAKLKTKFIEKA